MNKSIVIKKSPTADTRTCDWNKVSKEQLKESSWMHITDVINGLSFFQELLSKAAAKHDFDKVTKEGLEAFHADFATGFKKTSWFENHLKVNRHHIDKLEGRRDDINLIDVLEHITDCVMAGMARSGKVYKLSLPDEVMQKAFQNTIELLKQHVVVAGEEQ